MYENYEEYNAPDITLTGTELIEMVRSKFISVDELKALIGLEVESNNGKEG